VGDRGTAAQGAGWWLAFILWLRHELRLGVGAPLIVGIFVGVLAGVGQLWMIRATAGFADFLGLGLIHTLNMFLVGTPAGAVKRACTGVFGALLGALSGGLTGPEIERRTVANQRIRRTSNTFRAAMQSYKCLAGLNLIGILLALVSCVTIGMPPIGAGGKPFQLEEDEKQMWRNAEEIERQIRKSGILYEDDQLDAYLNAIVQKLIAPDVQALGLRPYVKVIQHPLLNAFALPHGVIYLHTGILARMENEAQLATVLGHELTHFTHRHTVTQMRNEQNKQALQEALLRVMQAALLVNSNSPYVGRQFRELMAGLTVGLTGAIWALASVRGYSRELEAEADEEGLKVMIQAGYDPNEAPKVFEQLQQELDARKIEAPFFFGTHPRLQERVGHYRQLLNAQYIQQAQEAGRFKNAEAFLNATLQLRLDNAVLDLHIGRLKTARAAIERHLQWQPHNPRTYFLLGEVYRRSEDEQTTQRAVAAYQEAARRDATYAEPHRELGFLYRAQNRLEQARTEFELYLALSPQAVDVPIIKGFLADLEKP
jgi:predicted Zn-dependent protease